MRAPTNHYFTSLLSSQKAENDKVVPSRNTKKTMSLARNDLNFKKLAKISNNIPQYSTSIKQSIQMYPSSQSLGKKTQRPPPTARLGTAGHGWAPPPSSLPPWDGATLRDWECADGVDPRVVHHFWEKNRRLVISRFFVVQ